MISGNSFGLQIAAGMNDNIVASATGQSSSVLLNSPNADQTNSLRSTRSLANLLAACVEDPDRHSESVRSDHSSRWSSSKQYCAGVGKSCSRSRAERRWDLRVDVAE